MPCRLYRGTGGARKPATRAGLVTGRDRRAIIRGVLRWLAAAGAFVASLDSTVNIAFPSIAAAFAAPPEQVRWVIICYVSTYALVAFAGGAAGDRLGHVRVFRAGAALTVLGFLVAGTAGSFGWLLAGRVVQGLGGGLLYGTAPALVTQGAPAGARGRALGFVNAAIGAGFCVGPPIGGALVTLLGWRAVFLARVPVALVLVAWALRAPSSRAVTPAARLVVVRDVLRARVVWASALALLANGGIFAIWLLAPFDLVERRGFGTAVGGALFMLTPLGTAVAAPLAGRLVDRAGPRAPMAAGLAIEAAGLVALATAGPHTAAATLGAALLAAGFGLGVFQVPNMAAIMAEFAAGQEGAGGGLAFLARTLGVVAGVAVLAHVFAVRRHTVGFDVALGEAFGVAAAAVAVAAIVAMAAPWRVRAR
jgi:MFS family permease